ncbi:chemotaxis protein CheB [Thalassospira mesophila]|uniref:Protein-glutamate methylesterase/protein-glutamine glutaminase n=1 Tax=Thalassospira mesophila TaxID=1293891 RepID=A0A1Y2L2F4_9PROT|nr:chemotaxis protein CheB [Thalassospira mesophila]OSQ39659.1 chemotaxis protein [Thalassospira mesophila]
MEHNHIDPPYKVLIVDDSAIVRGLVTRMLQEDHDIEVVGSVANGEDALGVMLAGGIEAVVLDIEMPVMDGLTALPKILEIDPTVRVIMASTLTKRNADISFRAMTLGAVDYIPKPSSAKDINVGSGFRTELVDKVKAWSEQRRKMLEQTAALQDEGFDDIGDAGLLGSDTGALPDDGDAALAVHGADQAGIDAGAGGPADIGETGHFADHGDEAGLHETGHDTDGTKPFRAELSADHQVMQKPGRIQRKRFTAELRPRPMQAATRPMPHVATAPVARDPGEHHGQPAGRDSASHGDAAHIVHPETRRAPVRDPGRLIEDAAVAAKKGTPAGHSAPAAPMTQHAKPAAMAQHSPLRPAAGTAHANNVKGNDQGAARPAGKTREAALRQAPPVARAADASARRGAATVVGNAPAPARRGRHNQGPLVLVPEKKLNVEAIAIGSSTGGPQALFEVLRGLVGVRQPIFITQHMPATFTTILAEHITRLTGLKCGEGVNGETVQPGRVYLAPGDYHMVVDGRGNNRRIALNQNAPENFCRPSVDPMLRSLVDSYGGNLLTIILTGMGQDGMLGGRNVVGAGGMVVAQDEATSVVWGMPGAAAQAGICTAILPIGGIAPYVKKFAGGR